MNKISELKSILGESFAWNKTRLNGFARMPVALFAVRTMNLSELAVAFGSKVKIRSRYIRLQRFFKQFILDYNLIAGSLLYFSIKPILFKQHWDSLRPQNNLFRYGFDFIRDLILNVYEHPLYFKRCLLQLIPRNNKTPLNDLSLVF